MPRFSCQAGCTACCRQSGFVYLTEADLDRIALHLGMEPAEFERKYVYRTRHLLRLRMPRHATCRFLHAGGCAIHAVKPTQCRVFPFWPELVESVREWRKAGNYCPGIGSGELVTIETAGKLAEEMRSAYPGLYARRRR
ncbi:MAG: YkgJ family cysteine cluster protein [Bryobacteraceae bacterium]